MTIDLRSDTGTRPTPEMLHKIAEAEMGDAARGDDPTVLAPGSRVAELTGKQAALYLPSGTMGNLAAVLTHGQPGDETVLERQAHIYEWYTGDLGRTVICGEPTAKQREIYRVVHASLREAIKVVRPGVTCHDVDRRAREVIEDAGWGKYQHTGNTGHQLGFGLHGDPESHRNVQVPIVENMVTALESRIILSDASEIGGAQMEDAIVVTRDGAEYLNQTPYDERLLARIGPPRLPASAPMVCYCSR